MVFDAAEGPLAFLHKAAAFTKLIFAGVATRPRFADHCVATLDVCFGSHSLAAQPLPPFAVCDEALAECRLIGAA
uniref:Uncharacterized protein n=1 Tax=Fulvimarina pelagi TaxID=217511 RepID=A0A0P0ZAV2_9HYPH|nr:hypothetical protein [Fulvimarina pelagi]